MKQGAQWLVLGVVGSAMLLTFCGGKSDDDEHSSGGGAGRPSSASGRAGTGGSTGGTGRAGFAGSSNGGAGLGGASSGDAGSGGVANYGQCGGPQPPDTCGGICGPGMCRVPGQVQCGPCGGAGNGGAGFGGCMSGSCACNPGMCQAPGSVRCEPCGGAGNGGAGFAGAGGCMFSDTCGTCSPGMCRPPNSAVCQPCGAGNGGAGAGGVCNTDTCGPVGGGGFGPEGGAANDGGASASLDWIPPSRKTATASPSVRACYTANASEGDPCLPPDGAIVGWLSDLPLGCDAEVKGGPFSATDERGLLCCYSVECLGERSVSMAR